MKKNINYVLLMLAVFGLSAGPVFAHAVVKPATAGIGSFTDFSLGVPSEKDSATIAVKLMIPDGINSVTPIVKPGWKVEVINSTKTGQPDDDGNVSPIPEAIIWTGGSIPAHQKDFFMFSTQVPAKETELDWQVEQTYADGTVISWTKSAQDQPKDEKGDPDFSKFGPFSKTMVINDLKPTSTPELSINAGSKGSADMGLAVGGLALILSLAALGMGLMHKKAVVA